MAEGRGTDVEDSNGEQMNYFKRLSAKKAGYSWRNLIFALEKMNWNKLSLQKKPMLSHVFSLL